MLFIAKLCISYPFENCIIMLHGTVYKVAEQGTYLRWSVLIEHISRPAIIRAFWSHSREVSYSSTIGYAYWPIAVGRTGRPLLA